MFSSVKKFELVLISRHEFGTCGAEVTFPV
jgi:hypothetical protein